MPYFFKLSDFIQQEYEYRDTYGTLRSSKPDINIYALRNILIIAISDFIFNGCTKSFPDVYPGIRVLLVNIPHMPSIQHKPGEFFINTAITRDSIITRSIAVIRRHHIDTRSGSTTTPDRLTTKGHHILTKILSSFYKISTRPIRNFYNTAYIHITCDDPGLQRSIFTHGLLARRGPLPPGVVIKPIGDLATEEDYDYNDYRHHLSDSGDTYASEDEFEDDDVYSDEEGEDQDEVDETGADDEDEDYKEDMDEDEYNGNDQESQYDAEEEHEYHNELDEDDPDNMYTGYGKKKGNKTKYNKTKSKNKPKSKNKFNKNMRINSKRRSRKHKPHSSKKTLKNTGRRPRHQNVKKTRRFRSRTK